MGVAFGCPALDAQEEPQAVAADTTPQDSPSAGAEREVSWGTLPRNLLRDQKDIWLFPVQLGEGAVLAAHDCGDGVTAALIVR